MLAGSHRNAWPDETGTGGRTNRNTQILYGAGDKDWLEDFKAIREGIVSKGRLSWPTKLLDDLYGEKGHKGTNHPQHQGAQAGNIPVDALDSWADRVFADIERRR